MNLEHLETLKGLTKLDVKERFGLSYNDVHSNIWMYYLTKTNNVLKPKYIYLIFKKDVIVNYHLNFFKTTKYYKIYEN